MLKELLKDRIEFCQSVDSWEDALKQSANALLQEGYMEQSYVDSMISNIKEFGPYIVLTDGVAMPHSRPESGAIKTGMSFLKVENGILFPETEVPVTLLFTLVASDSDSHLEAMMKLADIIGEDPILEELLNVTNKEELLKIISQ